MRCEDDTTTTLTFCRQNINGWRLYSYYEYFIPIPIMIFMEIHSIPYSFLWWCKHTHLPYPLAIYFASILKQDWIGRIYLRDKQVSGLWLWSSVTKLHFLNRFLPLRKSKRRKGRKMKMSLLRLVIVLVRKRLEFYIRNNGYQIQFFSLVLDVRSSNKAVLPEWMT